MNGEMLNDMQWFVMADMRAPARACQREHQCGEHQHHTLYYIIQAIGYQNSLKENKSDIIYSGSSLFGRQVYHKHYLLYILSSLLSRVQQYNGVTVMGSYHETTELLTRKNDKHIRAAIKVVI